MITAGRRAARAAGLFACATALVAANTITWAQTAQPTTTTAAPTATTPPPGSNATTTGAEITTSPLTGTSTAPSASGAGFATTTTLPTTTATAPAASESGFASTTTPPATTSTPPSADEAGYTTTFDGDLTTTNPGTGRPPGGVGDATGELPDLSSSAPRLTCAELSTAQTFRSSSPELLGAITGVVVAVQPGDVLTASVGTAPSTNLETFLGVVVPTETGSESLEFTGSAPQTITATAAGDAQFVAILDFQDGVSSTEAESADLSLTIACNQTSKDATEAAVESAALAKGLAAISNLPKLDSFLEPTNSTQVSGAGDDAQGQISFSARLGDLGDGEDRFLVWLRGGYAYVRDETGDADIDNDVGFAQIGFGFRPTRRTVVGVMAHADLLEQDADGAATADGAGFLIGPWGAVALSQNLFLEGAALYGRGFNEAETAAGAEADFNSARLLLSARLSGRVDWSQWSFRPAFRFSYYAERSEAFTDGDGAFIARATETLGQGRAGAELGYDLFSDERVLRPYVGVEGVYSYADGRSDVSGLAAGVDGFSAALSGGVEGKIGRATLRGRVVYEGLGAEDFDVLTGSAQLRIPFN